MIEYVVSLLPMANEALSAPEIYHYWPATKEYLGNGVADPSPLEEGVWLYPVHCTNIALPAVTQGQCVIWNGAVWRKAEEQRGELWFDERGQEVRIETLGKRAAGLSENRPDVDGS